ncbi:MAG: hypothetical protein M1812_006308 [Candelaria pacifica]|nr:MAG: hypothetical protein M1812_006308 [Candelaria pacifica]
MFAVPGWSVSSASLQTQTVSTQQPFLKQPKDADGPTSEDAQKSSKKRKRSRDKPKSSSVVVTSDNLAELWAKHIEGKDTKKELNGSGKSSKKRRKTESNEHSSSKEERDTTTGTSNGGQTTETKLSEPKVEKPKHDGKKHLKDGPKMDTEQAEVEPHESSEAHGQDEELHLEHKKSKTLKQKSREKKAALRAQTTNTPATEPSTQTNQDLQPKPATSQLPSIPPAPPPASNTHLTPLQASMRSKLTSARFRHLNQTLYTTPSTTSVSLFEQNPSMFADYHAGFRQQVFIWPSNPVDEYITLLKTRGALHRPNSSHNKPKQSKPIPSTNSETETQPLPRTSKTCIIADLGCGDGRLASELTNSKTTKKLKLKILSFDLQASNQNITKADIACLPLENGSVDIAIFCLALMGTNWIDFIEEAWRILRWKGELWIAEIKSRFSRVINTHEKRVVEHSICSKNKKKPAHKSGKKTNQTTEVDETADLSLEIDSTSNPQNTEKTNLSPFISVLKKRGFILTGKKAIDLENKMFVKMRFVKGVSPIKGKCVLEDKAKEGEGETWKRKVKTRFLDDGDDDGEDEAGVLKPCVYKLR